MALLEKQIAFEPIALNLDGDQFAPDFVAINPFHRIPVLVDRDLTLVESLAILDYIDAKYPTPPLLPTEAKALGIVRMVEISIPLSIPAETYLSKIRFLFPEIPIIIIRSVE